MINEVTEALPITGPVVAEVVSDSPLSDDTMADAGCINTWFPFALSLFPLRLTWPSLDRTIFTPWQALKQTRWLSISHTFGWVGLTLIFLRAIIPITMTLYISVSNGLKLQFFGKSKICVGCYFRLNMLRNKMILNIIRNKKILFYIWTYIRPSYPLRMSYGVALVTWVLWG